MKVSEHIFRNPLFGLIMPPSKLTDEKLRQIQELAIHWGKIAARRAIEQAGPDAQLDFQAMEQIAAAAARGVTEGTIEALCQQQDQQLPEAVPCPECGKLVPLKHQQRPLAVEGAEILLDEPVGHCPACRRDFFPSKDDSALG